MVTPIIFLPPIPVNGSPGERGLGEADGWGDLRPASVGAEARGAGRRGAQRAARATLLDRAERDVYNEATMLSIFDLETRRRRDRAERLERVERRRVFAESLGQLRGGKGTANRCSGSVRERLELDRGPSQAPAVPCRKLGVEGDRERERHGGRHRKGVAVWHSQGARQEDSAAALLAAFLPAQAVPVGDAALEHRESEKAAKERRILIQYSSPYLASGAPVTAVPGRAAMCAAALHALCEHACALRVSMTRRAYCSHTCQQFPRRTLTSRPPSLVARLLTLVRLGDWPLSAGHFIKLPARTTCAFARRRLLPRLRPSPIRVLARCSGKSKQRRKIRMQRGETKPHIAALSSRGAGRGEATSNSGALAPHPQPTAGTLALRAHQAHQACVQNAVYLRLFEPRQHLAHLQRQSDKQMPRPRVPRPQPWRRAPLVCGTVTGTHQRRHQVGHGRVTCRMLT